MSSSRLAGLIARFGLAVALAAGAWWTAQAVVAGDVGSMLVRLVVSVMVGVYYLLMVRLTQGRQLVIGRC